MLPEAFQKRMQSQLEAEYEAFVRSLAGARHRALRVNPLKGGAGSSEARRRFLALSPWQLEPVPWEEDGFYYVSEEGGGNSGQGEETGRKIRETPGRHPYHEAGVYYIQEPSAMAPVVFLGRSPARKCWISAPLPVGRVPRLPEGCREKGCW